MNTEPQPYRSTCASTATAQPRTVRALFQVIDTSDGEAVIETYRNVHLANKLAATSPAYEVREFSLT